MVRGVGVGEGVNATAAVKREDDLDLLYLLHPECARPDITDQQNCPAEMQPNLSLMTQYVEWKACHFPRARTHSKCLPSAPHTRYTSQRLIRQENSSALMNMFMPF